MDRRTGAIDVRGLSRTYGDRRVLDNVAFVAKPGRVIGYLGPNGSGKSTTLRILLGLARADSGSAGIAGRAYAETPPPSRRVGVLLENAGLHPGMTPTQHLEIAAAMSGTPPARIGPVLDEVGLAAAADRKIKSFSQGMRQRLGIALALLAEPSVLIVDEPANGLDPEGIIWLRELLRGYAAGGATVLVTSHVLSELERFIDDIVIIAGGRLLAQLGVDELGENTDLEAFYLSTLQAANHPEA